MTRMTRTRDEYECRATHCFAEDWIERVSGVTCYNWKDENFCGSCPFMTYINHLAEYEDNAEKMEDDLK